MKQNDYWKDDFFFVEISTDDCSKKIKDYGGSAMFVYAQAILDNEEELCPTHRST